MRHFWFFFTILILCSINHLGQATEYSIIEQTETISLKKGDRPFAGTDDEVTAILFEGIVNPNNNLTIVNRTVSDVISPIPLELSLWYIAWDEEGYIYYDYKCTVNGSLDPNDHEISQGDQFNFAFFWYLTKSNYAHLPHQLVLRVRTGSILIDFEGSVTLEVHYSLSGNENVKKGGSSTPAFDFTLVFITLLAASVFWRKKR